MIMMQKIINEILEVVRNDVEKKLLKYNVPQEVIDESFIGMYELQEPFAYFSTEHRRIKELKKRNFVAPDPIVIGEVGIPKSKGSKVALLQTPVS